MPKRLEWDKTGERYYEGGCDRGVLYPQVEGAYPVGHAWNGLTNVSETPSGGEENAQYADNIKYLSVRSDEEAGGTIECFAYPDAWAECDGRAEAAPGVTLAQQPRKPFGLCYRTVYGNDTEMNEYGYKLHLIWNATASPSERSYATFNDSFEATTMSYEYTTTKVPVPGYKPISLMLIDSTKVDPEKLAILEDILYGSDEADARLPLPAEVLDILLTGGVSQGEDAVEPLDTVDSTYGTGLTAEYEKNEAGNTIAKVSGKLNWLQSSSKEGRPKDGCYFAFELTDEFTGKPITVNNGGRITTAEKTEWVELVDDATKKDGITVSYKGIDLIKWDLSNVQFEDGISLTVTPSTPSTTYYGKTVSELQTGIKVYDDKISGKLKYVTDYTGWDTSAPTGNFLALDFDTNGTQIKVKVLGGTEKEVDAMPDKYCVFKIGGPNQRIEIKVTKDSKTLTKTYSLWGLQTEQGEEESE